ncbi:MAG: hypothetical protein JRN26_02940 [Nitrososphaerota archaeon]|jgi:hypothetical protein|nr:hypothetical protein [Nitrososphaerota archaeon]MDG6935831.1 hypothetical protein [Nitrososphaerota archaeon]MDG6944598.1 hypothetical protein [Nitrososphaerota archaeon]
MSEVLWWKKENWYESKGIPLFSFFVSPRQIIFILGSGILGIVASAFIPVYYAKVMAVFLMVIGGVVLVSLPSKIVPFELALLYHYRRAVPLEKKQPEQKMENVPEVTAGASVPFAITGELTVSKPTEIILFVDEAERAKTTVNSDSPKYRLYYYPSEEEKGVHYISVKASGNTLTRVKVNVI